LTRVIGSAWGTASHDGSARSERYPQMSEELARTVITIARQYLNRCCQEPLPEHVAIELAGISIDAELGEPIRAEARAVLAEAAAL